MLNRFIWRVKFTLYGQSKCPIGLGIWWSWSATNYDELGGSENLPHESAQEEIYQLAVDAA